MPDGPHVEVALPGGNKLAFDTEVDALYERLTTAGNPGLRPGEPQDAPQRRGSVSVHGRALALQSAA